MGKPGRPLLRYLDVKQVEDKGEPLFVLRDPLRVSDEVRVLNVAQIAICQLLDGTRTPREIAIEFEKRHGVKAPVDQVEKFLEMLDESLFLQGERVTEALARWKKDPIREPACAGSSYPGERAKLRDYLAKQYTRPGGPGAAPDGAAKGAPIRGVLSPHIDFDRGGHAYAHAWKAVAEGCEADLFVVLGTAHHGTESARFALTRKTYDTPLGPVPTDEELVERVVSAYKGPDDLFEGELAHKGEHSIEFQMVELAHLYGEGGHSPRKIKALPVLCGTIHDLLEGPRKPSEDVRVRAFQDALRKALEGYAPERVCFVGGVDLAHVGTQFSDPTLTRAQLDRYVEKDMATLEIVTGKQDADLFHEDLVADESRKICGHAPIHATLEALARTGRKHKGELLKYDSWYDGESSVTFCSVVFRDGKKRRA
jgi:AmmeMemoRadiSam system protein B